VSFFLVVAFGCLSQSRLFAQPAVAEPASPPARTESETTPDAMRAYLQLQEQLHTAQQAIERNRREAEAAAARNTEAIATRLQQLEQSLMSQRTREVETMQGTNRLILTVGGSCAALGFVAMLLTAYFQWRAVNRLTEFSVVSQASMGFNRALLPPGTAELPALTSAATEQAQAQLTGAVERLEKRLVELEHTTHRPSAGNHSSEAAPAVGSDSPIGALLAKGDLLLKADKVEEAVGCFDEILTEAPNHAEALVKKGSALEALRKFDEAIECYDRAIAADNSLTVAYLYKGGVCNRLERYTEALECYEQALRTQERKQPA